MRRRGRGGRRNDWRRRDHGRRTWVLPRREAPEPVRGGRGPARRRAHLGPDVARDDKLRPEGTAAAGHLGRRPGDLGPARQAAQRAGVCPARRQDQGPAARLLHHRQGGRGEEARLRRRQGALPARACGGRRGLPRQRRLLQGAAREGRAGLPSDARLLHGANAAVHGPARKGARAARAEMDRGVPPSGRLRRVQGTAAGAARQQRPRHYGRARVLEVRLPAAHRGPRGNHMHGMPQDASRPSRAMRRTFLVQADVLQPDITWMGGLTEARRVVAMAAAYDIPVIPHGSSVYSYHLQYAFHNCPVAELINLHPTSDEVVPYFGSLFSDEPLPKDGFIDLPDRPGFGVTLVRDGLHRPWARTAEESAAQYAVTSQADSGLVGDETRPRMGI
mmetsp:Transcript_6716/g.21606  ORF Transcript_6716/g.21606 Transcript_6716/m.21606 type:complete len:390 (-) Transcript_6716:135-1304(-)